MDASVYIPLWVCKKVNTFESLKSDSVFVLDILRLSYSASESFLAVADLDLAREFDLIVVFERKLCIFAAIEW